MQKFAEQSGYADGQPFYPVEPAPENAGYALIIEDRAGIAVLMGTLLRSLGYHILDIAERETSALLAASERRPDLILADDRLAGGSSIAAVEAICRDAPVPTVFLVADPAELARSIPHAVIIGQPFGAAAIKEAIKLSIEHATELRASEP